MCYAAAMNYRITVWSSLDNVGRPGRRRVEQTIDVSSIQELTEAITRVATRDGWRDLTVRTIGDPSRGIPLLKPRTPPRERRPIHEEIDPLRRFVFVRVDCE